MIGQASPFHNSLSATRGGNADLFGISRRQFLQVFYKSAKPGLADQLYSIICSNGYRAACNDGKHSERVPYFDDRALYQLPGGSYSALVYIRDHPCGKPFLVDMDNVHFQHSHNKLKDGASDFEHSVQTGAVWESEPNFGELTVSEVDEQVKLMEQELQGFTDQTPAALQQKNIIAKTKTALKKVKSLQTRVYWGEEPYPETEQTRKRLNGLYAAFLDLYKVATNCEPEDGWWPF
jgi:hypothetical protein